MQVPDATTAFQHESLETPQPFLLRQAALGCGASLTVNREAGTGK